MVATLLSCKEDKKNTVINALEIDSLNAETLKLKEFIFKPKKLLTIGDKLVVYDDVEENFFKVFDLDKLEFLFKWGKYGNGPDEFQFIDANCMRGTNDCIEFLDNSIFKKYGVGPNNNFELKDQFDLKFLGIQDINRLCKLNENLFIVAHFDEQMEPDKEHVLFSRNLQAPLKKFGQIPPTRREFSGYVQRDNFFIKFPVANANKEILMIFYRNVNLIKVYDFNGNLKKEIIVNDSNTSTEDDALDSNSGKIYFVEPFATDKYVYVLMINKIEGEIFNNFDTFIPEIQVWNWDGELKSRLLLNKPIITFAVSESLKKIYAIDLDGGESIFTFNLP